MCPAEALRVQACEGSLTGQWIGKEWGGAYMDLLFVTVDAGSE